MELQKPGNASRILRPIRICSSYLGSIVIYFVVCILSVSLKFSCIPLYLFRFLYNPYSSLCEHVGLIGSCCLSLFSPVSGHFTTLFEWFGLMCSPNYVFVIIFTSHFLCLSCSLLVWYFCLYVVWFTGFMGSLGHLM